MPRGEASVHPRRAARDSLGSRLVRNFSASDTFVVDTFGPLLSVHDRDHTSSPSRGSILPLAIRCVRQAGGTTNREQRSRKRVIGRRISVDWDTVARGQGRRKRDRDGEGTARAREREGKTSFTDSERRSARGRKGETEIVRHRGPLEKRIPTDTEDAERIRGTFRRRSRSVQLRAKGSKTWRIR